MPYNRIFKGVRSTSTLIVSPSVMLTTRPASTGSQSRTNTSKTPSFMKPRLAVVAWSDDPAEELVYVNGEWADRSARNLRRTSRIVFYTANSDRFCLEGHVVEGTYRPGRIF